MKKQKDTVFTDLDAFLENVEVPDANKYIANSDNAIGLFNLIIRNSSNPDKEQINRIKQHIKAMFALSPMDSISDELTYYRKMMRLCDALYERNKIRLLNGKAIVGLGGHFSAGKSSFINALSGIECALPVAQEATTSIPTYIICSQKSAIYANSVFGYVNTLTDEQMEALSHEFYDTYKIGFSSFIESIIVESSNYTLPKNIALLDTPGYTKADEETNSRMSVADKKKAFEQLRVSDYLIWLIDINNGAVTASDIDFIRSLDMTTDILVVFTKADMRTQEDIDAIIKTATDTLKENGITNCFGVTAYSSTEKKEYSDKNLIAGFFAAAKKGSNKESSPADELVKTIISFKDESKKFATNTKMLAESVTYLFNLYDGFYNLDAMLELLRDSRTIYNRLSDQVDKLQPLVQETIALINEYCGGEK